MSRGKIMVGELSHTDQYMGWPAYARHLEAAGLRVEHLETRPFAYSWNPGARVVLFEGSRT